MPFFRWAIVLAMFIFGAYIYQRDTNAQQVFNIGDMKRDHETLRSRVNELKDLRDKQFEEMNRKILTREVFEAYHKVDSERLDRMEKVVEQILDRQVK